MIMHWGLATPNRIAVRDHSNSHSYGKLRAAAIVIQRRLIALGEMDGYLAIISDDPFFVFAALTASMICGRRFVILSPNWRPAIFSKVTDQLKIDAFITNRTSAIPALSLATKVELIDVDSDPTTVNGLITAKSLCHSREICSLLTAGSEGGVPGVVNKTHHALLSEIVAWLIELRITSRTVTSLAQPLHYSGAILLALATLICGATVTQCRSRPETALRNDLHEFRPTHLLLIPSQYRRLRAAFGEPELKLLFNGLEVYLSLGDRLSIAAREELQALTPNRFVEMWGNTEGLGAIRKSDEDFDIRSVGRPFLGDDVLIDGSIGQDIDGNKIGRISVQSDAGAPWHDGQAGLISGHDLGYVKNGALYTVGRRKDVFISQTGSIISSWDIENLLHMMDRTIEVAVTQPNSDFLRILIAGIEGIEMEEKTYEVVADFLSRFHIKAYEIKLVKELPLTELGKIDRKKIATESKS
jgi:acyl-coenzyme A synthetase/AMP-(fatty) acid ligase